MELVIDRKIGNPTVASHIVPTPIRPTLRFDATTLGDLDQALDLLLHYSLLLLRQVALTVDLAALFGFGGMSVAPGLLIGIDRFATFLLASFLFLALGRLDLLFNHHGHGTGLYLNQPGLRFARQDSCAMLPCGDVDLHGAGACDYDGDGDWDIFYTVGADRGQGQGPNQFWQPGPDKSYTNILSVADPMADRRGRGRGAM